jgi:hypothetical protein
VTISAGVGSIGAAGPTTVGTGGFAALVAVFEVTGGISLITYGGVEVGGGAGTISLGLWNMWEAIVGS